MHTTPTPPDPACRWPCRSGRTRRNAYAWEHAGENSRSIGMDGWAGVEALLGGEVGQLSIPRIPELNKSVACLLFIYIGAYLN